VNLYSTGFRGVFTYVQNNPVNLKDPLGLASGREYGGGLGVALGVVGVSVGVSTKSCCDESGTKHTITIQSVCLGVELGLGINEAKGANSGVSDNLPLKSCPKKYDSSGYYEEKPLEAWGSLILGRYGNSDGEKGWKFGFGGGLSLYSGCRVEIISDYPAGKCCN